MRRRTCTAEFRYIEIDSLPPRGHQHEGPDHLRHPITSRPVSETLHSPKQRAGAERSKIQNISDLYQGPARDSGARCNSGMGAALLSTAGGGHPSAVSCRTTSPLAREKPMLPVRRREFITLFVGALAAWPPAARAQQKVPLIGFLGTTSASAWRQPVAAFERRLSELGWDAGRTITIDYRWTEGRNEQALAIAEAFVERKVDIIVAGGNAVAAAKQATSSIPIVFPLAVDPLGSGFVASLPRPGGNVTGLSLQGGDLAGKRLQLLREIVPGLRRLAIMVNVAYPAAKNELAQCQLGTRSFGIEATLMELRRPEDIATTFDSLGGGADALYVVSDALTNTNYAGIASLALNARLPTMFGTTDSIHSGGLMAYGPNLPDLFRRAGDYVDKILRGAKPRDIPVEQPTKFTFVLNLATAKALGLATPPTLLALADEVIE
ncbi:MAG: ABC transporter substrate-binding protein [Bradyrhizobium sp.]|nr:ABC transporter substrate-binding protein [Bradyrhizobium sp.]